MPKMNKEIAKPKNFKKSFIRLLKELKDFKVVIIISLVLACISSILSLITPNKISALTDEISLGIKLDTNSLNYLIETTKNNYLNNNMNPIRIKNVIISVDDQNKLINAINTEKTTYEIYNELPEKVKEVIEPKMNLDIIENIAITLLIIYIISAIFNYFEAYFMTRVSNKFAYKIRNDINNKINRLPLKFFDKHIYGDILSVVTNDVETISQSLDDSLSSLIQNLTLLIGSIIMMFVTNWILAITAIISSLIGFSFIALILVRSQKYFSLRQKELGKLNGHIEEVYSGLTIIKAYNAKEETTKIFDTYNHNLYTANQKSQFLSGMMPPLMNFAGNLGYVAVCIAGAILAINGNFTFGTIIAFTIYVRLFSTPLQQIGQVLTNLQSATAASERVFDILDEEEMEKEVNHQLLKKDMVKGEIEFKDVSFTYDGNLKPTIENFSMKCAKGSKIAIVGPTGAGKTTIVNLLMKFYNISAGDILIDGVSIKDLTRENIHDLFTMVLQDTWLFEGTVKENLIYNQKNITEEKLNNICRWVGVDHLIKTMPNGLDSKISENDNISSGERQLLTIARANLNEKPFVILDEATSNVDTRTEELVQSAMDNLTKGKTSFIIAHRLSTIKNADMIIVMNEGKIIEKGTHESLLKENGFYAELYNSQFEL